MALYQPSFMIPKNQAIDATDENDMTFSFKLNGNNPLVAYNIQIYDNDTNQLVYELVSTANERAIQAKIQELANWLANQIEKQSKVDEYETQYKSSDIKTKFRDKLKTVVTANKKKLTTMTTILGKKKAGQELTQTEITNYFQYWETFLIDLKTYIGNEENPLSNTGEYILNTIEGWLNIDPARTDGIEYKDEEKEIIDRKAFIKIKDIYNTLKRYYEDVAEARKSAGASDTTYINDTTFTKAQQCVYLLYSEFANESYFNKDLYESINTVWNAVDFDKLRNDINQYTNKWRNDIEQQEYALAHLNGGKTKQQVNIYKSASASASNVEYVLEKGAEVAVVKTGTEPPSGWKYIVNSGRFGYIQSQYVQEYNIQKGKYYLERPIYPTNYEGEQNIVEHQLPIGILQNGKSYKWSATLYWSTSGRYDEDDKIDGSLISVENYFDTRKKPVIGLKNYKQVFTIPFNYVTVTKTIMTTTDDGQPITIAQGASVRIINLVEGNESLANIEYISEDNNIAYTGVVNVSSLSGIGLYNTSTNYLLPSKKVTFEGLYEQEQFVSISYFRWILYKLQNDTEKIVEVVKDTGMVPSVDFKFVYDGFLNDEKYAIQIFVQTLDNVEAQTDLIKFKVSYIGYEIDNMLNAENSPIEHGIIVEWSNLRLIQGSVEGNNSYIDRLPMDNKTSLSLDKNAKLLFDKDKGQPLAIDWDANHIMCVRFDEERPQESQTYYTASGLDDNGAVISKTLEMIVRSDTQSTGKVTLRYTIRSGNKIEPYEQEIIASALYWYIIILKKDGFTIFTKYAQGLFPAIDQYPNLNKFTGSYGLYPDALTYLEEPSDRVEYNYQSIVDRNGNEIK